MKQPSTLSQHVALFGESGSGKTVLLSSFYGPWQDGSRRNSPLTLKADDSKQANTLFQNWLGMREHGTAPMANRFDWASYSFTASPRSASPSAAPAARFHLVWHDYPGEWFDGEPTSAEESRRRIEAFRALLSSHVAFLLVDGQRLLDNEGQEHAYLKALFHKFRVTLESMHDELLTDGPLEQFPRIWVIALTKADLHPTIDATRLRDLVILHAAHELNQLGDEIASLVQAPEAVSLGENFITLSSAKFTPGKVDTSRRLGVDVILPLALLKPLTAFSEWGRAARLPQPLREALAQGAATLAPLAPGAAGWAVKLAPQAAQPLLKKVLEPVLASLFAVATEQLTSMRDQAVASDDPLRAAVAELSLTMRTAEDAGVLLEQQ